MAVKALPTPAESSHTDGNQQFTLIGVQGTLGTADVTGSAATVSLGANPATGALYVETTNAGAASNPTGGTLNMLGTVGNLNNGSVNILTGTLQNSGSSTGVGVVSNLTNGSVNILTGTLQSSGTTTGIGVVSNLTNGSINILTGTITSVGTNVGMGTLSNIGSVNTITTLAQLPVTAAGSDATPNPTLTKIAAYVWGYNGASWDRINVDNADNDGNSNLTMGMLSDNRNRLYNGATWDLQRGTLGTAYVMINPVPVPTMLQFGTLGTAGGSFFGTLSAAAGAGTKHYVTGVDIVMQSGTADVRVLAGSAIQGTGILAAGAFAPNGGISKRITPAFATGTNSELIYHFVGAGTAFITVAYWKGI